MALVLGNPTKVDIYSKTKQPQNMKRGKKKSIIAEVETRLTARGCNILYLCLPFLFSSQPLLKKGLHLKGLWWKKTVIIESRYNTQLFLYNTPHQLKTPKLSKKDIFMFYTLWLFKICS